jgi:predicted SPOUT superfamily RNA methylase MTH1
MEGIEGLFEQDESSKLSMKELKKLFDLYLTTIPERGTRNIRTEESILASMGTLYPKLRSVGLSS